MTQARVLILAEALETIQRAVEPFRHSTMQIGGILIGRRLDPETIVVVAATGPGLQADQTGAEYALDRDLAERELAAYAEHDPGLGYLGEWHRHPGTLELPTPGDWQTAARIVADPEREWDTLLFPVVTAPGGQFRIRFYELRRADVAANRGFTRLAYEVVAADDPRRAALQPAAPPGAGPAAAPTEPQPAPPAELAGPAELGGTPPGPAGVGAEALPSDRAAAAPPEEQPQPAARGRGCLALVIVVIALVALALLAYTMLNPPPARPPPPAGPAPPAAETLQPAPAARSPAGASTATATTARRLTPSPSAPPPSLSPTPAPTSAPVPQPTAPLPAPPSPAPRASAPTPTPDPAAWCAAVVAVPPGGGVGLRVLIGGEEPARGMVGAASRLVRVGKLRAVRPAGSRRPDAGYSGGAPAPGRAASGAALRPNSTVWEPDARRAERSAPLLPAVVPQRRDQPLQLPPAPRAARA